MTKKDLEKRLEDMRTEYKSATSERKKIIHEEAEMLKHLLANLCYECEANARTEIHFPFCSAPCHEEWAKKNYHQPKRGQQKSIEYMQKRLIEMGKEVGGNV